ncbi:hypothetical protein A4X13_0g7969 [Tilletia indica]|uniref:Uncharacterized protein n=1 Tax=Tilletia indica TaxID=43049 RepID=A0A177TCD9_9BASI|nr:hypothetical protein A4X13_0g7969 [Tilletia indica]
MAPKPEPATGSSATTRSQKQREAVAESAEQPSTPGGEELPYGDMIKKIFERQEDLIVQVASLQEHRSTSSQQMEDLTTRMSRVELSSNSDSPPSNPPAPADRPPADRPSDDVRVAQTVPTPTASRPPVVFDTIPATLHEFMSKMAPGDQSGMREILGRYGADKSVTKLDGRSTPASTAAASSSTTATAPPLAAGNRSLVCKKDVLGEFDGTPAKLEAFLGRVKAILHSNRDSYWETAVVCTLPQCLTGDAQVWHTGLSEADSKKLTTVDAWCQLMRRRFPVNKIEQRQQAHKRIWDPPGESSLTYFYNKVQLFRHAYGQMFTDDALAQQVLAGLPATMRSILRLPQEDVSLDAVQDGLCDWEPTWREAERVPLTKKTSKDQKESADESDTATKALTSPPARPPRSEQRPFAALAKPTTSVSVSAGSPPSQAPVVMASLSDSYDPTRVIAAGGGQPRMYRRPDSSRVMKLARNCAKCGGQHFDFEHDHLQRSGQIRNMAPLTDDYPEVEEEELGLAPF